MPDVELVTTDPFAQATAAAIEDIQAALGGTVPADAGTTEAEPAEHPAAAASGAAVGHGRIRLHGQLPGPSETDATTTPQPDPAAAADAVGHGTIRLHGRTGPPEPGLLLAIAEPIEPEDPATGAAREDILATIDATA